MTLKVKGRVRCYSPALAGVGPAVLTAGPARTCVEGRREGGMGGWVEGQMGRGMRRWRGEGMGVGRASGQTSG